LTNKINKILAVIFIALFSVNIILPSIVLFHFKISQEYIAKNLCVEKDIEESSCAGNCQLKKSLEIIEKGNSNQDELRLNIESHISFLFAPLIEKYKKSINRETKSFIDLENRNLLSGFYDTPFRPPILL
jgi:nucleoside recognition membrane protein YjiH